MALTVVQAAGHGPYNNGVDKKPLIETNIHLRVPEAYRKALITNVSTSTAIETSITAIAVADVLTRAGNQIFTFEVRKSGGSSR